jgi:gas vesicle protein GvpO
MSSVSDRASAIDVLRKAAEQLAQLTGRTPDTVSAIEKVDDGWRVEVELVELERIPSTTNILATYEVDVDERGDVVGYRRLRRYFRNAAEEG